MAHSCPDCGSACYCGGDIDDCIFDDTPEQNSCTCCFDRDESDDYDDWYEDEDGNRYAPDVIEAPRREP